VSFEALRTGAVIRFPYLWAREAAHGETEGRKFRPVAVGVRIPKPRGEDVLVLFPITSHEPAHGRFAAEIPDTEKRRAGLDGTMRLWIVMDEYNREVSSTGQCNTCCSLSAGVSKPKVFRGR
jgi:hypothetical protein